MVLVCTPFGCEVETTPWIEHKLPDLVVSAYNEPGDSPWDAARQVYGGASKGLLQTILQALTGIALVGGGHNTDRSGSSANDEVLEGSNILKFKEVSAIGNPFVNTVANQSGGNLCTSDTEAFRAYFQSEVDGFVWRFNGPELLYPASYIPRFRYLGDSNVGNEWGGIHPRHGFILTRDDMEAAAVASARAVDVITRSRQPHVYSRVSGLPKSDEESDRWSMIYPKKQAGQCMEFGNLNYSMGRQAPFGGYAWLYWGKHNCCINPKGPVIAKIDISPVCL